MNCGTKSAARSAALVLLLFGLLADGTTSAQRKMASVQLRGKEFQGNITIEEIASTTLTCTIHLQEAVSPSRRYKVTFFPLVYPVLQDVPTDDRLNTFYNASVQPGVLTWSSTFNTTLGSLTKGDFKSVLGRSVVVESCPLHFVSDIVDTIECEMVAKGVVGRLAGAEHVVGGSLESKFATPITNAICLLSFSSHPTLTGTMLIKRKPGGVGHETLLKAQNIPNGGGFHALRIVEFADFAKNRVGGVYDHAGLNLGGKKGMHGFPCATGRRTGDLGNAISGIDGKVTYRGVFIRSIEFTEILGRGCALYSLPDKICEATDDGCSVHKAEQKLIAVGVIGIGPSDTQLPSVQGILPRYDCSSTVTLYGRGFLRPFNTGRKELQGLVEFFDDAISDSQEISMQLHLSGLVPNSTAYYGLGILVHGDERMSPYAQDGNPGDWARFNPGKVGTHGRPPYTRRVGDLGNIQSTAVSPEGTVRYLTAFASAPGQSDFSVSLDAAYRSIMGRMFVVYDKPDDGTQPNGRVGSTPLLWGVIGAGTPPKINGAQEAKNDAEAATLPLQSTKLVCRLRPTKSASGGVVGNVTGIIRMSLDIMDKSLTVDGAFANLTVFTPYQWLLYSNGDERGEAFMGRPLGRNMLQKGPVPACFKVGEVGFGSASEGNFGILESSASNVFVSIEEQDVSLTGLGKYVGRSCAIAQLDRDGQSEPFLVAAGVVGIASSNYMPAERFSATESFWASASQDMRCSNDTDNNTMATMKTSVKKTFVGADDAIYWYIGVTLTVVALLVGGVGLRYGFNEARKLSTEGPMGASTIDDAPPPPPAPKEDNKSRLFQHKDSVVTMNPLMQHTGKNTRGRSLPKHPSTKFLNNKTTSFYNPSRLEKHRSQRAVNKITVQSMATMSGAKDRHGRTLANIPIHGKYGMSQVAIGAPPQKRLLPTHPSRKNMKERGSPHAYTQSESSFRGKLDSIEEASIQKKQSHSAMVKRATEMRRTQLRKAKRLSKAVPLESWDQLKIGVRSSLVGFDLEDMTGDINLDDSDYEYQSDHEDDLVPNVEVDSEGGTAIEMTGIMHSTKETVKGGKSRVATI